MNVTENACPNCKKSNELEAVVCRHCGTALEDLFMDPGARTLETSIPVVAPESTGEWSVDETVIPEHGVAIYIEGKASPVHIDSREGFVIGRKAGGTSKILEAEGMLDLSPMGGYGQGISRRHATIRRAEKGYEILDLGSVNGTWLNGKRLTPHQFYPLISGSHLRLGNMRLFVLYNQFAETK